MLRHDRHAVLALLLLRRRLPGGRRLAASLRGLRRDRLAQPAPGVGLRPVARRIGLAGTGVLVAAMVTAQVGAVD
ncbi:hypothetical protein ABZU52_25375, partial [Micromonospora sp. NPDC005220]